MKYNFGLWKRKLIGYSLQTWGTN